MPEYPCKRERLVRRTCWRRVLCFLRVLMYWTKCIVHPCSKKNVRNHTLCIPKRCRHNFPCWSQSFYFFSSSASVCDAIQLTASLIQVQKNQPKSHLQSQFFPETPLPRNWRALSIRRLLFSLSLYSSQLTFFVPTVNRFFEYRSLLNNRYHTAYTDGVN